MNCKRQSALFLALALVATSMLSSCSTTKTNRPPLSATILNEKYSLGTFSAEFKATIFQLDKAVRRACARARLTKTNHAYRTSSCSYRYVDIDKIPVQITITQMEEGTQIKLKVDSFGDEESSRKLLVAIDEELKILTQGPAPATDAAETLVTP